MRIDRFQMERTQCLYENEVRWNHRHPRARRHEADAGRSKEEIQGRTNQALGEEVRWRSTLERLGG
jgi:hypothetical protein